MTNWVNWRATQDGITWRLATPDDALTVSLISDMTERCLRRPQKRPDLFAAPVMLAFVAEDERGMILDAVWVEMQAEICKAGLNRRALAAMPAIEPALVAFLQSRQVHTVRIRVLRRWRRILDAALQSMHFHRDRTYAMWRRQL